MISLGKAAGVSCLENGRPVAVRLDHNDLVPLLDTESAVDREVQIASPARSTVAPIPPRWMP